MSKSHVVVVGGGIVGLATARALAASSPELRVTVLEKEPEVGRHQSTHNSGVLHAGLAYSPGSRKARLARLGIRRMVEFCQAFGIAHDVCGKLVVASDVSEVARLRALLDRGERNGLQGLQWLSPEEAREVEPNVRCAAAILVPEEGIVDFGAVCTSLAAQLVAGGAGVLTSREVRGISRADGGWRVATQEEEIRADFLVNCAGLHVDRVLEMTGEKSPVRIVPFRGEYYRLREDREMLVRNLIYPIAPKEFPFLGVHFTRRVTGGVEAGPNAVLALAREGYAKSDVRLRDLTDSLTYPGLWRFVGRHRRMVAHEVAQSLSKRRFVEALRRLVPAVGREDLVAGGAGVRAQAMLPTGELVHDFHWVERPGALHALNVPSPAATASLAIGDEIAAKVVAALGLDRRLAPERN